MKKTLFSFGMILSLFHCTMLFSQEIQKIIPPSPNAYCFHNYGNIQTNYYTGSPNITIPIWEIKEGDISIPIYLKYTGGNGIKVEEIASWVGLGWTLNTGGAISRTIRGLADEDQTKTGYLNMTEIPLAEMSNLNMLNQIEDGLADGEPDKYWYNIPNASGSFFFDLSGNVHTKPKRNISISYRIGTELENVSSPNLHTYDDIFTGFTILDEYGNSYEFNDKERSNSRIINGTYSDARAFPNTWYLSKVRDMNRKDSVLFDYDTYTYNLITRKPIQRRVDGMVEDDYYMDTYYIGKRLSLISYSQGSLEFVESTQDRADLPGNKYLEEIIVRDFHGAIIKKIKFEYQYMTPSGVKEVNNIGSFSSAELRLLLKSVNECDANNNCEFSTDFEYEDSVYLPSRYSYAQDHWGYYNGVTSNTTLEPKQIIKWYNPWLGEWVVSQSGSADRSADANFSIAGILRKVKYPYGGETIIEYEGHTALNDEMDRPKVLQVLGLMWNNTDYLFDIDLYSSSYTELSASGMYIDPANNGCKPKIYIENLATNITYTLVLDENNSAGLATKVLLEPGSYRAWFVLESDIVSSCSQTDPATITLKWENEDSDPTVPIGGVRVKSISDFTTTAKLATKKYFSYSDSTGYTSGRLVNVPRYYGLVYKNTDYSTQSILPVGYETFVTSSVPLANTQGSSVGYGKVSVYEENMDNGLQEYYYSTSDDTPDVYNGINPATGNPNYFYFQGEKIYPYPRPEVDSRDFLRGILKQHKIYKKEDGNLSLLYDQRKELDTLTYAIGDLASVDDHIRNETYIARGLKMYKWIDEEGIEGGTDYTYYDLFSGYALDWKIKETNYYGSNAIEKEKILEYERDSYGLIHHYIPIATTILDSKGVPKVQKTKYLFNKIGTTSEENELIGRNALYMISETNYFLDDDEDGTLDSGELLKNKKLTYDGWGDNIIALSKNSYSKTDVSLKSEVTYHSYNSKGKPTEISKNSGPHKVYIWGYKKEMPIAELTNITHSDVEAILTSINSNIMELQALSDADDDNCTDVGCAEQMLRDALQALRSNLPDDVRMISYTYDPLVGITSMTDSKGKTIYYVYDDHNRLTILKDSEENLIKDYSYNIKGQY